MQTTASLNLPAYGIELKADNIVTSRYHPTTTVRKPCSYMSVQYVLIATIYFITSTEKDCFSVCDLVLLEFDQTSEEHFRYEF